MKHSFRYLLSAALLASLLTGCGSKDKPEETAAITETTTTTTEATTAPAEGAAASTTPAASDPAAAFDVTTVPISTADLGQFPYIAGLKGFTLNTSNSKEYDFERAYVYDGKTLLSIEGKVSRRLFDADRSDANGKKVSELVVDRNYENQLKALGAVKVWTGVVPKGEVDKVGNDEFFKHTGRGTDSNEASDTYLIRQKDKEVWVQLNSQAGGDYGMDVVEKAVMPQLTTTMPAADLKKN